MLRINCLSALIIKRSSSFKIKAPAKPSLLEVNDTSMLIKFAKWVDPLTTYTYVGEAVSANGTLYLSDCDSDASTCLFIRLTPARTYSVGLRSCYSPLSGKTVCSPLSPSIDATTNPSGKNILIVNFTFI